jgi:hypothetical protein
VLALVSNTVCTCRRVYICSYRKRLQTFLSECVLTRYISFRVGGRGMRPNVSITLNFTKCMLTISRSVIQTTNPPVNPSDSPCPFPPQIQGGHTSNPPLPRALPLKPVTHYRRPSIVGLEVSYSHGLESDISATAWAGCNLPCAGAR